MMTISSTGIGQLDMTAMSKVNPKSKEQAEETDAFASLMNMGSTNSSREIEINDAPEDSAKTVDNSETIDREAEYASDDVYKKTVEPEKADGPDKVSDIPENNKYNTEDNEVISDEKVVMLTTKLEELTSELKGLLDELKVMLKDLLAEVENIDEDTVVTDEQIQEVLSSMGINLQDLLKVSELKNFILELNGSTEVNVLIDEKLASMINKFTAELENILKTNGISDVESFLSELETTINEAQKVLEVNNDSNELSANSVLADTDVEAQIVEDVPEKDKNTSSTVIKNDKVTDTKIEINVSEDSYQSSSNSEKFGETKNQIMTNLNQAIENALNTANVNDVSAYLDSVQEADIIRQIIDNIKLNISKETTSLELQLNPEHLGKVQINVASKDGVMQAQIIAETEAAKNAIEGSIAALKEAFQNQDLKVEAVEVMVATYEFFNQSDAGEKQGDNSPSKKTGVINMVEISEEEMSEDELIEAEMMRAKGNSVSYSV